MVTEYTFILLLITFLGSHLFFEWCKKNGKLNFSLKTALLIGIGTEILLIVLAGNIEIFFFITIYATVIIASFINVCFRNRAKNR